MDSRTPRIALAAAVFLCGLRPAPGDETRAGVASGKEWTRHVIHEGVHTNTAVAADFTGDGRPDVVSSSGSRTRLFVAPHWKEITLDAHPRRNSIHSEVLDADRDGDPDWVGARYKPGLIFWLERPDDPLSGPWKARVVDEAVDGVHGLIVGDVDRDGRPDLLANSAQPGGRFPESLVWYRVPEDARSAKEWERFVLADRDAPGLSHYLGFGDVDGDGRPDVASAAKGGPSARAGSGDWFAWWEAPEDPRKAWKKHPIATDQKGATNIHPADVDGDGRVDFIASRGHDRGVLWFEAPSWKPHAIHASLAGPHCLVVADLDTDGDVDAATCAKDDRMAVWFENDGSGRFRSRVVGRDQAAYDIRASDLDGDGDLDLLIAGQQSRNVVWYENPRR